MTLTEIHEIENQLNLAHYTDPSFALDTINALLDHARATLDDGWIDVHSQPLPDEGGYLTFDTQRKSVTTNFIRAGKWFEFDSAVTHWRNLPNPPK